MGWLGLAWPGLEQGGRQGGRQGAGRWGHAGRRQEAGREAGRQGGQHLDPEHPDRQILVGRSSKKGDQNAKT